MSVLEKIATSPKMFSLDSSSKAMIDIDIFLDPRIYCSSNTLFVDKTLVGRIKPVNEIQVFKGDDIGFKVLTQTTPILTNKMTNDKIAGFEKIKYYTKCIFIHVSKVDVYGIYLRKTQSKHLLVQGILDECVDIVCVLCFGNGVLSHVVEDAGKFLGR